MSPFCRNQRYYLVMASFGLEALNKCSFSFQIVSLFQIPNVFSMGLLLEN